MATSSHSPSTPEGSTPTTTTHVPVLISGGGPTGLLAGVLLSKLGIPTTVIERDMTVSPLSKAVAIHPRSLEILRHISPELSARFEKEVWVSHKGRMFFGGKLVAEIPWDHARESQFHHSWGLPQTSTIRLLTEEYERMGVGRIERGWELMDTKVVENKQAQDAYGSNQATSWVETTVRRAVKDTNARKTESAVLGTVEQAEDEKGKEYEIKVIRSEFLIGADGGRSTIRHVLNIPFPGRARDFNIILFDGHIETDLPLDEMASINGNNLNAAGLFPLAGNRVRFLLNDGTLTQEEFDARKVKTPTKEYFENLLQETVAPHKVKILSYNWLTYYRANERRATEFVYKQRIFLAGDAAHSHSPNGGQGLNLGLQDSYNLAWKIAMVLKGTAPLSLVDSYNEERVPVADEIIQRTSRSLTMLLSSNFFIFYLRKAALTLLSYTQRFSPTSGSAPYSMLGLRYYANSLNKEHTSERYPKAAPGSIGQRAPDDSLYPLAATGSDSVRLYNLMDIPGAFQVLVFTADRLVKEKGFETTLYGNIEHYHESWLSRWPGTGTGTGGARKDKATPQFMVQVVSYQGLDAASIGNHRNKDAGFGKVYLDSEKADLHRKYGITVKGGIVVVRPDTHIAYRVASIDKTAWADVDDYFGSVLIHSSKVAYSV